jgi:hypothetical protein
MRTRAAIAVFIALLPIEAHAVEPPWFVPPVGGVVARRFQAPEIDWGPGHRGIDYRVPAGSVVGAAGSGLVTWAGEVAGFPSVTIQHEGRLETTYSILSTISVAEGDEVVAGQWIGRVGEAHPGEGSGLHFGVKLEESYVDPEGYLGPTDVAAAIHLVPLVWEPPRGMGDVFDIEPGPQSWDPQCLPRTSISRAAEPPNGNVAIAVAGIGSHTAGGLSADMYEHGPEWLGYPETRVYRFSYRGIDGPGLHHPYTATDTYGDLVVAAKKLRSLVEHVAELHPGRRIDLIAHSQGGIVARAFLELVADGSDWSSPRVEHLVTFATPHTGADAASLVEALDRTVWGRRVVDELSRWSRSGGSLPDPRSAAVEQLAPGSDLMDRLGERTLFGTRVLALAIPHDVVVPANRALLDGATSRVVAPAGLNGHSAIVTSEEARGIAYGFLRDAAASCETGWDWVGPLMGGLVGGIERNLASLPGLVFPGI